MARTKGSKNKATLLKEQTADGLVKVPVVDLAKRADELKALYIKECASHQNQELTHTAWKYSLEIRWIKELLKKYAGIDYEFERLGFVLK